MIKESFTVEIHRPVAQVFAVLTDLERYLALWAKGPVAARKTNAGEGVGTTYEVVAKAGPFTVSSPYEVEQWSPPNVFGGAGIAGPVAFREEYVLSGNDQGTTIAYRIEAQPRGPFRFVQPVVRWQLRRLLSGDLARLRALVERTA